MAADNWVRQGGFSDVSQDNFDVYHAISDITAAEHGKFLFSRDGKAIFWNGQVVNLRTRPEPRSEFTYPRWSKLVYPVVRTSVLVFVSGSRKERVLVNTNGFPTRTRDRKVAHVERVTAQFKIDASHRFVKAASDFDKFQRDQGVRASSATVERLSPATRRVLAAVRASMLVRYAPEQGYLFRQYVNRAAIALALGREQLVPYDIRMLRHLCDVRLIQEYKHPLPRKQLGDIWLGSGAEYVYTIPVDTLVYLLYNDPSERARLIALARAYAGVPAPSEHPQNAPTKAKPFKYRPLPKRSLLDRFFDWIGI